jgi:diguanylate cyclase
MYYNDSFEQAGEFLRIAIKQLTSFKIPPDPVNYVVMYDYASGRNNSLVSEVDQCIKNRDAITVAKCRDWYEQYVIKNLALKTDNLVKDFRSSLDELLHFIAKSASVYPEYGTKLQAFSDALAKADSFTDVIGLVKEVIRETAHMSQSTNQMVTHLTNMQTEIQGLRQQLANKDAEANTDQLTGLLNRRGLEKSLIHVIQQAHTNAAPLSVIMIDIDHFKRINDTHGHLVGDNVLQIVAHTIRDGIKGQDIAARYGGEEFVILLPDTPLAGGAALADKIRTLFENQTWRTRTTGQAIGKITISAGVALYRPDEEPNTTVRRADEALYASKKNGRNQVTSEDQLSGS